jgi:rubrerythrin
MDAYSSGPSMRPGCSAPARANTLAPRTMSTAYDIFARAERVELAAAALYRRVAGMLPWSGADRELLLRLEEEEFQHAARIRLLAAQYRNDPRLFQISSAVLERFDEVDAAGRELLREIEDGRWTQDLQGLKARIAEMEERCGATHAEALADSADERIGRFFRLLAKQDREHRAMLLGEVEIHHDGQWLG